MSIFTRTTLVALALAVSAGATATAFADDRGHGWGMRGGPGERGQMRFERIDADRDGAVTFDEFSRPMLERFEDADLNADGFVTAEEIVEAMDRRRAERFADRMVWRFDIDGDDKVAVDELQNRQQKMFALMDFDDSGEVTEDELPHRFARGDRRHGAGHGR
ncbi:MULTISPECIES: acid-shock protein [unclassified Roseitalea]|uniref:EF-hand domain-containing protein n=1 Tax=unclassified Roseitalea TaxID=2639107 RepID=UPI00273E85F4|nr:MULTISPECIES: acid-shock protein [unclassified Roseitalea]